MSAQPHVTQMIMPICCYVDIAQASELDSELNRQLCK